MPFSILDFGEVHVTSETMLRGTGEAKIWVPVHGVLFSIGDTHVLYDAGCGDDDEASGFLKRTPSQHLEVQLANYGVSKDDLFAVVISHMHSDHFGGAYCLKNIPVYVPEEDMLCIGEERPDLDYRPLSRGCEPELLPGLKILSLPGHTENLLGLAFEEAGKKYLFVSDALYTPLHIGPPVRYSGYPWNDEEYRITAERIIQMTDAGWEIVWNHWPIPELKAN